MDTPFEAHTKAVGDFLSELYAVMVDPLADGMITVGEMKKGVLEAAKRDREAIYTLRNALGRFVQFNAMVEAARELDQEKTWADDDVVLSFMGCGASDNLTAGDFRNAARVLSETPEAKDTVPVGVSVLITNGTGKVLLGERINISGAGMLSTPGGRINRGEYILAAAKRELLEETSLVISTDDLRVLGFREWFRFNKQYIMFYVWGNGVTCIGPVRNMEPDKCKSWEWYAVPDIPRDRCTEPDDILRMVGPTIYGPGL